MSRYPDIEVEIFEAAEKLAEVGAGIGLFSRKCLTQMWTLFIIIIIIKPHLFVIFIGPWEVVQKLDLEEDLLKLTEQKRTEDPGNISRGYSNRHCRH